MIEVPTFARGADGGAAACRCRCRRRSHRRRSAAGSGPLRSVSRSTHDEMSSRASDAVGTNRRNSDAPSRPNGSDARQKRLSAVCPRRPRHQQVPRRYVRSTARSTGHFWSGCSRGPRWVRLERVTPGPWSACDFDTLLVVFIREAAGAAKRANLVEDERRRAERNDCRGHYTQRTPRRHRHSVPARGGRWSMRTLKYARSGARLASRCPALGMPRIGRRVVPRSSSIARRDRRGRSGRCPEGEDKLLLTPRMVGQLNRCRGGRIITEDRVDEWQDSRTQTRQRCDSHQRRTIASNASTPAIEVIDPWTTSVR